MRSCWSMNFMVWLSTCGVEGQTKSLLKMFHKKLEINENLA